MCPTSQFEAPALEQTFPCHQRVSLRGLPPAAIRGARRCPCDCPASQRASCCAPTQRSIGTRPDGSRDYLKCQRSLKTWGFRLRMLAGASVVSSPRETCCRRTLRWLASLRARGGVATSSRIKAGALTSLTSTTRCTSANYVSSTVWRGRWALCTDVRRSAAKTSGFKASARSTTSCCI